MTRQGTGATGPLELVSLSSWRQSLPGHGGASAEEDRKGLAVLLQEVEKLQKLSGMLVNGASTIADGNLAVS